MGSELVETIIWHIITIPDYYDILKQTLKHNESKPKDWTEQIQDLSKKLNLDPLQIEDKLDTLESMGLIKRVYELTSDGIYHLNVTRSRTQKP